jgi:hypothetical protein
MHAAGFILTGQRKIRRRAHPPMILAHNLPTEFFGIEERVGYYPDFESFNVWPATARVLWRLRRSDFMAGQTCLDEFWCWRDPQMRRIIICLRKERARAKRLLSVARLVAPHDARSTTMPELPP